MESIRARNGNMSETIAIPGDRSLSVPPSDCGALATLQVWYKEGSVSHAIFPVSHSYPQGEPQLVIVLHLVGWPLFLKGVGHQPSCAGVVFVLLEWSFVDVLHSAGQSWPPG